MSRRGTGPPRPALGSLKPAHPTGLRRFPATKSRGDSGNALHHLRGHVSTGLTSRPLTATPLPPRPAAGPLKPAHPTGLTTFPAPASGPLKCAPGQLTQVYCADEGGMGMPSPHDATTTGAPRPSRPEGGLLRPRAWIPEESGQAGLGKSPQTRRRIARDGWQITQARPGVMPAPGFAVPTSLLYHVFLEASR